MTREEYALLPGAGLPDTLTDSGTLTDPDAYFEYAEQTAIDLPLPEYFTNNGKIIGKVNIGFTDCEGSETNEVTFEHIIVAAFIQYYFDSINLAVCIHCNE